MASKTGWLLTATAALLGGCSLAPDYQRPTSAVPPSFKEAGPWQPAVATPQPAGKWWQAFGDASLNTLEDRVETGSFDLAAAVARYDQARALVRQARADLYPQIDANVSVDRSRLSGNRPIARGLASTQTDKIIGGSLAYELDLFGRVRNNIAAGTANARASAFDVAGVRLGLQSQLAATYFDLRGLDARIILLNQTVASYQRAFDLTDTRHSGGIASGIDVSRAQAQLSSAKSELSSVEIDRAKDEHAIAVLIGETPATFSIPVADDQTRPPTIAPGLPSTLLERRPDIAAAERRVAAANAQIGIARAAFFPNVTLGAQGGFESVGGDWLNAASSFWALGPLQSALTLFDGGRRAGQVRQARAQFAEAAANYRQTVLTAFREVEDDLATQRLLVAGEANQAQAAKAAEQTRDLALIRYRDGASDYLEVVTAQTAALDAERALLQLRTQQLQAASDTYRALGGDAAR